MHVQLMESQEALVSTLPQLAVLRMHKGEVQMLRNEKLFSQKPGPFLRINRKGEIRKHLRRWLQHADYMHGNCYRLYPLRRKLVSHSIYGIQILTYKFYFSTQFEPCSTICGTVEKKNKEKEIDCSHLAISSSARRLHFLLKPAFLDAGVCVYLTSPSISGEAFD